MLGLVAIFWASWTENLLLKIDSNVPCLVGDQILCSTYNAFSFLASTEKNVNGFRATVWRIGDTWSFAVASGLTSTVSWEKSMIGRHIIHTSYGHPNFVIVPRIDLEKELPSWSSLNNWSRLVSGSGQNASIKALKNASAVVHQWMKRKQEFVCPQKI